MLDNFKILTVVKNCWNPCTPNEHFIKYIFVTYKKYAYTVLHDCIIHFGTCDIFLYLFWKYNIWYKYNK